MSPDMTPVDSSNIVQVGYDPATQELYVEFLDGRTYVYSPVPDVTYDEFMNADSKGSYLNREIKPNFDCRPL
ncbi:MAG: hypothetical protein JWP75_648 [Frondihabitans sp.]|nr:hypothetical protein [Frondihabitans sp.]